MKMMLTEFITIVKRWLFARGQRQRYTLLSNISEKTADNCFPTLPDTGVPELPPSASCEILDLIKNNWEIGRWKDLIGFDIKVLSSDVERREVIPLIATAVFQIGNINDARDLVLLSGKCSNDRQNFIGLLICGVYNSLARARLLLKDDELASRHIKSGLRSDRFRHVTWLQIQARLQEQQQQLNVLTKAFAERGSDKIVAKNIEHYLGFESADYWEHRYKSGGTSGFGSYGRLADFKAKVINQFISEKEINGLIEFGCGDGSQLEKLIVREYVGVDVSATIVDHCKEKFKDDSSKRFFTVKDFHENKKSAPLTLSLDVIFHLVEDRVFHEYMQILFDSSELYCIIYSCNGRDLRTDAPHVIQRMFTSWVASERPDWKLIRTIENEYPHDGTRNSKDTSFSDFYIYEKIIEV